MLRKEFPPTLALEPRPFKILVHAHENSLGASNEASIAAVGEGADGVWSGFTPTAAQVRWPHSLTAAVR